MPLPRHVIEKRSINRMELLEHVKNYLLKNVEDDSLHDSLIVLEEVEFMCGFRFQHILYTLPLSRQQREQAERNYMKAVLNWKCSTYSNS